MIKKKSLTLGIGQPSEVRSIRSEAQESEAQTDEKLRWRNPLHFLQRESERGVPVNDYTQHRAASPRLNAAC